MQNVALGSLNLYEAFAFFFIYAFFGWIVEVAYHAITMGKFVNRGFLNGPVCPIYGVGVTVIILMLGDLIKKPWVVALVGLAFPTAIELVTGFVLDKLFHNKWWDYSDRKLNLKGYICLEFSLLWCLAVVAVIEVVHPLVARFVGLASNVVGTVLVSICIAAMLADTVITVLQVLKLNRKLAEIDRAAKAMSVGAELIGKGVTAATLKAESGLDHAKTALAQKRDDAIDAVVRKMPKRLLKAFPRLASRKNPDSVSLAHESMFRLKKRKKQTPDQAPTAAEVREDHVQNSKSTPE